jgi:hypothetical protein
VTKNYIVTLLRTFSLQCVSLPIKQPTEDKIQGVMPGEEHLQQPKVKRLMWFSNRKAQCNMAMLPMFI